MKFKNKKSTAFICTAAGVCMLGVSVLANYSTANGYDSYKKSLKYFTTGLDNYTLEFKYSASMDGETIDYASQKEMVAGGEEICYYRQTSSYAAESGQAPNDSNEQMQIGDSWYMLYPNGLCTRDKSDFDHRGMFDISDEDRDTVSKLVRFGELLTDTVVGDLKNNFVYTGESSDGGSSYSIELDAIQIPELINAGISALCSMESSGTDMDISDEPDWFDTNYYLYSDVGIRGISLSFDTDGEGRLRSNNIDIEFSSVDAHGKAHSINFTLDASIDNYGTTKITPFESSVTENAIDIPRYDTMDEKEYEAARKTYEEAMRSVWGDDTIEYPPYPDASVEPDTADNE